MTIRRVLFSVLGLIFIFLIYSALTRWGLENSQRRFLSAIEDKDWPEVGELISDEYRDRFEFDAKELSAAVRDVAEQFILSMNIEWTMVESRRTDKETVVLSGNITLSGSATNPIAAEIVREVARYRDKPVLFTWRKENRWPWSWRLVSIDLPGLEIPSGYEPGNFGFDSLNF